MRTRSVLVIGVLLAAMTAGCGPGAKDDPGVATAASGAPTASSEASADAGDDPDAALKFSKCMRDQGLDWFPDPRADGRMELSLPQGVDAATVDKAAEKCEQYLPDGGGGNRKLTPEQIEQNRQLAKCMRANGVPNFPDPDANGDLGINASELGTGPGDPTFDAADKACARYHPKGAGSETHQETT